MSTSRPFPALYGGRCVSRTCHGRISPGEMVRFTGQDDLIHDECTARVMADDHSSSLFMQPSEVEPQILVTRRVQPKVCPDCHLSHAGECF